MQYVVHDQGRDRADTKERGDKRGGKGSNTRDRGRNIGHEGGAVALLSQTQRETLIK